MTPLGPLRDVFVVILGVVFVGWAGVALTAVPPSPLAEADDLILIEADALRISQDAEGEPLVGLTAGTEVRNNFDSWRTRADGLFEVSGWALDTDDNGPASFVAVLSPNGVIAVDNVDGDRPDVAQALGMERAVTAGYGVQFRLQDAGECPVALLVVTRDLEYRRFDAPDDSCHEALAAR